MHIRPMIARVLLFALLLVVAGCAGYRGGWYNEAYTGDPAPDFPVPYSAFELQQPGRRALPGLTLQASLNNRVQTNDRKVVLFVVPAGYDPQDRRMNIGPSDRVRLYLTMTVIATEGATVTSSDDNRRRLAEPQVLAPGSQHRLWVDFQTAIPPPQHSQISVDLSNALKADGLPALPLLKFKAVRWKQGYT
jgi:hypothetical protein